MVEIVFKPKKRIFIALASLGIIFAGLFAYLLWRVSLPGLEDINQYLPAVVRSGWSFGNSCFSGWCLRHRTCNSWGSCYKPFAWLGLERY